MVFGSGRAALVGIALSCFMATGAPSTAHAQTDTATIRGAVTDSTDAVVPSATVRLIDIDRGVDVTTTTGNGGRYAFASVRPGRYEIEVQKSGFKVVRLTGITINVLDNLEQNVRLELGPVATAVRVEAGVANVNASGGAVSTVIDRQVI